MSLTIVHYNDPVLRKKGEKIAVFDDALRQLSAAMVQTMQGAAGIGLAAQQVGRALQLCVVDLRQVEADFAWEFDGTLLPLELFMPLTVVNPKIKVVPGTDELIYEEGCLSFPEIRADVVRPDAVVVNFQDEHGSPHVLRCDGLLSRCLQHEADHLNGVLFIDRMEKKVRATINDAVKALAQQTRDAAKS